MFSTIQLGCCTFFEKTILVQLQKDILGDISLLLCGRPAKYIKTDIEPAIDGSMNGVVFVAKFLWCDLLKKCSRFRTRSVFISSCLAERISFRLLLLTCCCLPQTYKVLTSRALQYLANCQRKCRPEPEKKRMNCWSLIDYLVEDLLPYMHLWNLLTSANVVSAGGQYERTNMATDE